MHDRRGAAPPRRRTVVPAGRPPRAALALALLALVMAGQGNGQINVDVLVIGAGVAGIKAAATLQTAKPTASVTVLEARPRAYGRVDTIKPAGWPVAIEAGAQWFHGTTGNPVYGYATSTLGMRLYNSGRGNDAVTYDGGAIISDAADARYDDLLAMFDPDFLDAYRVELGLAVARASNLSRAVEAFMARRALSASDRRGLLNRVESEYVQEYAASLDRLNLQLFDAGSALSGPDSIATGSGGYAGVFASLLASLKDVRLGHEVKNITWPATMRPGIDRLTVEAVNSTGGRVVFAPRFVISTLPLGVLKARRAQIFPGPGALSAGKRTAIDSLAMGTLNKVVLQFATNFWGPPTGNVRWIDRLITSAYSPNEFFNLAPAAGQNILVAFYAGTPATTVEALADAATVANVVSTLRGMFGAAKVPDPLRAHVTRWGRDPLALGSYSYVPVGATANARTQLGASEAGTTLWFAGEATNTAYPGTVQGAWLSGEAAAKSVAALLK